MAKAKGAATAGDLYRELESEAEAFRSRINSMRTALTRFFVDKTEIIDLMTVAAVAHEPLLLVGPPGTCKSELVVRFKDAIGVPDDDYFEYMLTRFTEPSEVLGPIDINKLRDGAYIRRCEGRVPTASVLFIDELFKANSAILNVLLTILNEKKWFQDGKPEPVKLKVLFAASNEIPEQSELAALKDRFVLKVESQSVQETKFTELIDAGLRSEVYKGLNQKPWAEGLCSLEDIIKANRYLTMQFGNVGARDSDTSEETDRQRYFPDEVFLEFQRLVKTLVREDKIFISDRKLVKLYKLLRVRAWLFSGGVVSRNDLRLLAYLGETRDEIQTLRTKIPQLLGDE